MEKIYNMISDEMLAAYLDGNVSSKEKNYIEISAGQDDNLQEVIDIMSDLGLNSQNRQKPIQMNNNIKITSGLSAAAAVSATRLVQMYNQGTLKFHRSAAAADIDDVDGIDDNPKIGFAQAETTHGKPEMDIKFDPDTFQYYKDSCAFQSQSIVLKDYGINVSQEELMEVAKAQGWYVEGHGTPLDKVGKLMEHYDVPTTFTEGNNVFNLTNELAQGHRIIVTVDSGELWHKGIFQNIKDVVIGDTPNHALVVVGVDTTNPDDVKVIVTDPGNGNLQMAYSEKQFVDAWKDSNCFMAATDISPEEFINHVPPTHMEQFAGIPYSCIERLANGDFDSSMSDFGVFVSNVLAHPDDVDELIEEYESAYQDESNIDGESSASDC